MKNVLLICLFAGLSASGMAAAYTPPPGSPLAMNAHPRIFFTAKDLPRVRAKIQTYYADDLIAFINDLNDLYTTAPGSGDLGDWNQIFGASRSFAFLHLIDPASLGISTRYTARQYGEKAIEMALYIAANLPDNWSEPHHGVKNLSTSKGGVASLALQVVYDWTRDISTIDQRRKMADRLITMWNNRYDSNKVKLENHYAANVHVYGGALCFYGDSDLGTTYMTKANEMMDSFQDVFMTRQLGVAAKLFEGTSDWMEGDSYSMDGYVGLMMLAGAASSALGENLFVSNPWIHYAPYYVYYSMMPMPYKGLYYFSQQNTSSVMEVNGRSAAAVMNMAAAMLADADPDLASFCAWFTHDSHYGVTVDEYKYHESYLFDLFYKFIYGTRQVQAKTPTEAEVPLSLHLGQMHVMRSDHGFNDATLIQFFSHKFWYSNGHNEPEQGAFNIHRFGPLAVSAANSKNSGSGIPRVSSNGKGYAQNNVLGLGDDYELDVEMGAPGDAADTPEYFEDGKPNDIGTVEAREYRPGMYDYINYNYTRSYKDGDKASLARRALVYLRAPVNHEFVVVMDRVESSRQKYFVLHTVGDLESVGGAWTASGAGHWTTSNRLFKVVNRIDQAHGQMYVTSVLPQQVEIHKFGGPGKEWVWADGTKLDYSGEFGEIAKYLLSDHTLQIRSQNGLYLTVMQIGDANTIGPPASVESISGNNFIGVFLENERVIIFNKEEGELAGLSYRLSSAKQVKHLITELQPNRDYTVRRNGTIVASGTTGKNATISFADTPGNNAEYSIELGGITPVESHGDATLPSQIKLMNYPNPFNPETTISYTIPVSGKASLKIFNLQGQRIRTLLEEPVTPGEHTLVWDGRNDHGERVASGVYISRLELNQFREWSKLVLAR